VLPGGARRETSAAELAVPAQLFYTAGSGKNMTQETVRIVALVLLVVIVAVIILRRRGKKGKSEDDF
jgi:hypothetical protein